MPISKPSSVLLPVLQAAGLSDAGLSHELSAGLP